MDNKVKNSTKFANLMNKATDFGKKTADGIQKGAKDFSDQTQKTLLEQRIKYYNPLFRERFFSKEFALPNVIQIVDDNIRKGIDVCEGAIGWTEKKKGVEILFLYDEFVKESGINFVPTISCDSIYCVDCFDRNRYVNQKNVYESSMNEKMAELEHIAFSLAAKSFSIQMIESESNLDFTNGRTNTQIKGINLGGAKSSTNKSQKYKSGENVSYFEGERDPVRPTLKWFQHDENIKNLIEMRCSGNYTIKSKKLVFKGSSYETISRNQAAAIDALSKIKGDMSMEKQAIKEHNTQMILEIEF